MAMDLTKRQAAAPAKPTQSVGLSTFVRNKLSKTMTGKKLDDFITAVVSIVNNNPKLAQCDQTSLLSSCLQAQSLNLSLNQGMGQAWIVPYNNKKKGVPDATFQLGYKGYIQLAIRSGQYKKLNVLAIKAGELKSWDPLNEEIEIELIHNEREREKAETIGYYAMFEYVNGFKKALYWSREKMEAHADRYSQAFSMANYAKFKAGKVPPSEEWKYSSFWYKDFDAMAIKTMLRQLISKWGIMSIEMQNALIADGKTSDGEYIDGTVLDTEYQQTPQVDVEVTAVETVNPETGEVTEEPTGDKTSPTEPAVAKNATTAPTTVECPDRDDLPVSVEYCNTKCAKRNGCPMFA